ncbi:MAG: SpoIIE family protein phosphatase [Methanomicrobiales archaeon]|nr:SpoIIE family protein phosphatase [Methanomicrobiales archaeon]
MVFELERLVDLCDGVAVLCLIAYFLTRTRYASVFVTRNFSPFSVLFMTLIGGIFYLYGILTGVEIGPYFISIQVLGPVIAGLISGIAGGFLAGVLGMLLQTATGNPIEPAACLITLLSGIIGGIFWQINRNNIVRIPHVFFLGCLIGIIQFSIGETGIRPEILEPGEILEGILDIFLPTIAGLVIFVFIINNLRTEAENTRRSYKIEGELQAARQIQLDSLPGQTFTWKSLNLAASLIPVSYIGGDLYDYRKLEDGSLYFALGDVSGKGVPAALLMSSTRMILRSRLRETKNPCALVSEVNRSFLEDGDNKQFLTLITGHICPDTGEVTFCNAGHPPPFIISRSGTYGLEPDGNLPAGIMEDEEYISRKLTLKPGDILTIVSDGVTEAERGEELYGFEQVVQRLNEKPFFKPEDVVKFLNKEVRQWTGDNPQSDDCTILAIGYYPEQ